MGSIILLRLGAGLGDNMDGYGKSVRDDWDYEGLEVEYVLMCHFERYSQNIKDRIHEASKKFRGMRATIKHRRNAD